MSTNDEAVQVLKEAMESPAWWTNRAQPTAREVVRKLEEQGYTVARTSDVRAGVAPGAQPAAQAGLAASRGANVPEPVSDSEEIALARAQDQARIASLMAEVESSMNAVRGAREAQSESQLTDEQRESA